MSAPLLMTEVALVYRVGRRRWFTKRAAIHAMARAWVKARCDCEPGDEPEYGYGGLIDPGSPGHTCKYHNPERFPALIERLNDLAAQYVRASETGR